MKAPNRLKLCRRVGRRKATNMNETQSPHPVGSSAWLDLLRDCFEDEIAHLQLRLIRDAQAPRFEALKESHPEIYADFIAARNGPHETLLHNRRKRVEIITAIIERSNSRIL